MNIRLQLFTPSAPIRYWHLLLVVVLTLALFPSPGATAPMFNFLKKEVVYLSPAVHGQITNNGEPVADATVTRTLSYNQIKKPIEDRTTTAADGSFSFPEKVIEAKQGSSMATKVRRQEIDVSYQGTHYLLWFMNIHTIRPVGVVAEKLSQLNGDLTNEEQQYDFHDDEFSAMPFSAISICKW